MDEKELRELVERLRLVGADRQRAEVKSGVGKAALESLSAFSNGAGGTILVGLEERGGSCRCPVSTRWPSGTRWPPAGCSLVGFSR